MNDSTAKRCLAICPLFEAELLTRLMLTNWNHPFAANESFVQELVDRATEVLDAAAHDSCSDVFIDELPASQMNFVSAVWYAEYVAVQDDENERDRRREWLNDVHRALPSCFCRTDLLEP